MILLVGVDGGRRAWGAVRPGPTTARLNGILLVLLSTTIAGGLGILVGGARPHEPLHFVYAVVAVGAIPIGDALSVRASARARGLASLAGAIVGLIVVARLFGTG